MTNKRQIKYKSSRGQSRKRPKLPRLNNITACFGTNLEDRRQKETQELNVREITTWPILRAEDSNTQDNSLCGYRIIASYYNNQYQADGMGLVSQNIPAHVILAVNQTTDNTELQQQ